MQALNEWIGNIVILILIAFMMELLIPNTQLHKYVKTVIGLLLILLLLSPLFSIFSIKKNELFENIQLNQQLFSNDFLEKNMNQQKKEIEATQAAYIEKQMAVHLKRQVEEELMNRYEMKIDNLTIQFDANHQRNDENIQSITVWMSKNNNKINKVARIEKVKIGRDTPVNKSANHIEIEIKNFLANEWDIAQEKLIIEIDGREHS